MVVAVPSLTTVVGLAMIVAPVAAGVTNVTVGCGASATPSPVAVSVTISGVVSVTVNAAAPSRPLVALAGVTWAPPVAVSVTALPVTG